MTTPKCSPYLRLSVGVAHTEEESADPVDPRHRHNIRLREPWRATTASSTSDRQRVQDLDGNGWTADLPRTGAARTGAL